MNQFINTHLTPEGFAYVMNPTNANTEDFIQLKSHIAECEHCKFELSELEDTLNEVFDVQVKAPSAVNYIIRIAAIILVAFGAYLIAFQQPTLNSVNKFYESMIHDNFRSIEIVELPDAVTQMESDLTFIFSDFAKEIKIELVNVDDEIVSSYEAIHNRITISKSNLNNGVFYWKVYTQNELIKVGKIIVD